jgi:DNA-directed RNA polymerase subunit RPC12/RpoP
MYCDRCRKKFYGQMISMGRCVVCGKPVTSPHVPAHVVCRECSEKVGLCEQCGRRME